jgi:hypothetical protein
MLGTSCSDCEIVVGDTCIPCPSGSDFPECAGCVNGARPERTDVTKDIVVPVVIGVLTTLTIALITTKLMKQ